MVHKILKEMEDNNVEPDNLTLNSKLQLYAAESNIKTMEKLLAEYDANTIFTLYWRTSCKMAEACLKHGLVVEAVKKMRRAKELVDPTSKKLVYESLTVLYGDAGKGEDVYRIWDLYKVDVKDKECRSVISALLKLNDINGAIKVFKEMYFGDLFEHKYDIQNVAMIASACCESGQTEEAMEIMYMIIRARAVFKMMKLMAVSLAVAVVYISFNLVGLVIFILKMALGAI
ncbi:unnamed protein product [Microthlaspi erraticum]|uniref:Pentacotripeptide-repeat region of PRORP domain-containing protein n=1 Tax=Microthlaspi erraticum TaxID=1685480 RepID=A0A6D2HQ86_9BRAS|nr:unnamed protein product [Microthlaspi erraticum]CAA7018731.1 unnamed protein product [Microthlaspi erraticum]CAA7042477.1 unnamed protein product [Microthlaspi erraticum]